MNKEIFQRKDDHIKISMNEDINSKSTTWLECVRFVHNSLPEIDLNDIDISMKFLGKKKIEAPIIIGALTGGTELGLKINQKLAAAAEKFHIPLMVGSQRIQLEYPDISKNFSYIRENAPNIPIIANLGISQLIQMEDFNPIDKIIQSIEADAIAIHLNPLQEIIQPEGETNFSTALQKISELNKFLKIPLIIKETGAGLSKEVSKKLNNIGVNYLDISGLGGTSFAAIEHSRAKKQNNHFKSIIGNRFLDWGIPTAASIIETKSIVNNSTVVIGCGGIRNGLEIAKAIAIGADLTAIAQPFLKKAYNNSIELEIFIKTLISELKSSMFLTGSENLKKLQSSEYIIFPPLSTWLEKRGIINGRI
ncbi:MAG: type 2 isopentenyl-diphosphate Delta-isomerase [Promethearchaeota archaeon]